VTVMVAARAEVTIPQSSTTQIGIRGLKRNRKRNFFFTCGVPVEKSLLREAHQVRQEFLAFGVTMAGFGRSREIAT
jgi:hypothetical protein